jgi:hypothetical protein
VGDLRTNFNVRFPVAPRFYLTSVGKPNPEDKWEQDSVDTILMCNPVPQTPMPKQLQVNINLSTASLKQLCIFKEVVKVI